jgi:hypothetical protein
MRLNRSRASGSAVSSLSALGCVEFSTGAFEVATGVFDRVLGAGSISLVSSTCMHKRAYVRLNSPVAVGFADLLLQGLGIVVVKDWRWCWNDERPEIGARIYIINLHKQKQKEISISRSKQRD